MNWVGGARRRITLKNEQKTQKEYFERKQQNKKIEHFKTPKRKSGISQDLLALHTVDTIYSGKTNDRSICEKKFIEKFTRGGGKTSTWEVQEIKLPHSPITAPSRLQLEDSNFHALISKSMEKEPYGKETPRIYHDNQSHRDELLFPSSHDLQPRQAIQSKSESLYNSNQHNKNNEISSMNLLDTYLMNKTQRISNRYPSAFTPNIHSQDISVPSSRQYYNCLRNEQVSVPNIPDVLSVNMYDNISQDSSVSTPRHDNRHHHFENKKILTPRNSDVSSMNIYSSMMQDSLTTPPRHHHHHRSKSSDIPMMDISGVFSSGKGEWREHTKSVHTATFIEEQHCWKMARSQRSYFLKNSSPFITTLQQLQNSQPQHSNQNPCLQFSPKTEEYIAIPRDSGQQICMPPIQTERVRSNKEIPINTQEKFGSQLSKQTSDFWQIPVYGDFVKEMKMKQSQIDNHTLTDQNTNIGTEISMENLESSELVNVSIQTDSNVSVTNASTSPVVWPQNHQAIQCNEAQVELASNLEDQ